MENTQKKKWFKRSVSLAVVVAVIAASMNISMAGDNKYVALFTNDCDIKCNYKLEGKALQGEMPDFIHGLHYILGGDETDMLETIESKDEELSIEKETYVSDSVDIKSGNVSLSKNLVAKNTVEIKGDNLTSDEYVVICSEEGDVILDVEDIDVKGIIYAPNGEVVIKSKTVDVVGCIVADEVDAKAKKMKIAPTEDSENMYTFFENYRNDGYMLFQPELLEDGNLAIYGESNKNMVSGDIYVRYDDSDDFINLGTAKFGPSEIAQFEAKIAVGEFDSRIDVIIKGFTKFGDEISSDVESMELTEEDFNYVDVDTDEDGIEDGLEIFYLDSNPYLEDTDLDGFTDKEEVFSLCSNPNGADDETDDYDEDGVSNKEEMEKRTNPYLKDSDFDGKADKKDKKPHKSESEMTELEVEEEKVALGAFDKMITYFDNEGNCVQKVYNHIKDNVKLEVRQDVVTKYYYDLDTNRMTGKIVDYDGEQAVSHYEYSEDGDRLVAINNNNYRYDFEYSEKGGLTKVKINDTDILNYTYSEDNNSVEYATGYTENVETVDTQNKVCYNSNGEMYTYNYDEEQKTEVLEYADSGLNITYKYDDMGSIEEVTTNAGFSMSCSNEQTEDASKTNITYTIGDETYVQENVTEYTEESVQYVTKLYSGSEYKQYGGDDNKTVYEYITGDGTFATEHSYGDNGYVLGIAHGDILNETYSYTAQDYIASITAGEDVKKEYEYDQLGKVISAKDSVNEVAYEFQYDMYNNILSETKYEYKDGKVGEQLEKNTYTYSDEYGDKLTGYNDELISYDMAGYPTQYLGNMELQWQGNKLVKAVSEDKNIEYQYDAVNNIISKTVNGVTTSYNYDSNRNLISEETEGRKIVYIYDRTMNIIGFMLDGKEYFYVKNSTSDIVAIVDSTDNLVCKYDYDVWGSVENIEGDTDIAELNKYRYKSYYFDSDMGMYYLKSRFYDQEIGRFISPDRIDMIISDYENNINSYAYCVNNPVNYGDGEGTAARCYVMGMKERENVLINIGNDLENYFGSDCNVEYQIDDNFNVLNSSWDNMRPQSVVVIEDHGPVGGGYMVSISGGTTAYYYLYPYQIKNWDYKAVAIMVLLVCYGGDYSTKTKNVAQAFSTRVSGCVVACDDSNYLAGWNEIISEEATFFTVESSYGYLIYKHDKTKGTTKVYNNLNIYTIKMRTIINFIKQYKFLMK